MKGLISIMFGLIWIVQVSTKTMERCNEKANKAYYIYNRNFNVERYYCIDIEVTIDKCEDLDIGETVNSNELAEKCGSELYDNKCTRITPLYGHYYVCGITDTERKSFIVCKQTALAKVKLKGNEIYLKPIDMQKYSKTYVFYGNCTNLEQIYQSIWREIEVNSKKYIINSNNDYTVELLQKTCLCEYQIWVTNIPEIFATDTYIAGSINNRTQIRQYHNEFQKTLSTIKSECELDIRDESRSEISTWQVDQNLSESDYIGSKCNITTKFLLAQDSKIDTPAPSLCRNEEIAALRNQLHCVIFVIIICKLWLCIRSAFDMYINFLTLRRAAKKQAYRKKMFIMNCVSQSLTNRYLFLNENPKLDKTGILLDVTRDADTQNLYESVD